MRCRRVGEGEVIAVPYPHVFVESNKKLHGWYPWNRPRECTSERLLINPYVGCSINCVFCYAKALPGRFNMANSRNIVFVYKDYHKLISKQLDTIKYASCGYLSPVTDPFQPINLKYKLSEKIIYEFVKRNIPIEFITKEHIPDEVISLIKGQRHSFGQVSIITLSEWQQRQLVPGGATIEKLFKNIERLSNAGVYAVCRIDPIIPYITDNMSMLSELIKRAQDCGARHIVASCLDIPIRLYNKIIKALQHINTNIPQLYLKLYQERWGNSKHAATPYRKQLFSKLRQLCDRYNLTFALCMEYKIEDGNIVGMNEEFASSKSCEGMLTPIYYRKYPDRFEPIDNCDGVCSSCASVICGWQRPKSRSALKLSDYQS